MQQSRIIIGPFGAHYAKLVDSNGKYIKWADDHNIMKHLTRKLVSLNRRGTSIDLNVPFAENQKAKSLKAKWDYYKNVWFVELDNPNIDKILNETSWITVDALEFCESHKDTKPVYSSDEVLHYLQFRVNQGWDYDMDWGKIRSAMSYGFY